MNMFKPVVSEEAHLAHAVAPIGSLIGIGEPGEDYRNPARPAVSSPMAWGVCKGEVGMHTPSWARFGGRYD